jgi:phosphomevalonate kinase
MEIEVKDSKKLVLLISGKRFSGKDTLALLLKNYFESKNRKIKSMAFAYATKIGYCKENNLDLSRMVNDYIFKESHRDGLLNYFLTNGNYDWYAKYVYNYMESEYNNFDVFIIPDLRIKQHMEFFKKLDKCGTYKSKYKSHYVRIDTCKESKMKRGWIQKPCDLDFTETDLDDCNDFDLYITNDDSIDDLNNNLKKYLNLKFKLQQDA